MTIDDTDNDLLAPAVKQVEEMWGVPLTPKERECVRAGYELALETFPAMYAEVLAGIHAQEDLPILSGEVPESTPLVPQ